MRVYGSANMSLVETHRTRTSSIIFLANHRFAVKLELAPF